MLCTACERIFDASPKRPHPKFLGQYVHHDSAEKIEGAAASGCQVCSIIWDRFTADDKLLVHTRILKKSKILGRLQSTGRHLKGGLIRICWWVLNQHIMQPFMKQVHQTEDFSLYGWSADLNEGILWFFFGTHGWKVVSLTLSPCKEILPEIKKFITGIYPDYKCVDELIGDDPVERSMDTPATWALVDSWATKCSARSPSHFRCHQNINLATSGVPTRLIDVNAKTASGLRLSVLPSERMPLPYLTLSYTWGDVHPDTLPLLRKTSIADYTREIPEDCLPTLFKDTVNVTRRLGYRYLWIDAFCILQDDPDDFQTEAALMGKIYQNAMLNIAAGGASSSREPLMRARNPSLVNPCKVDVNWSNLATSLGRKPDQIRFVGPFYIFDGKYTESQMIETSLNRRAWVLQEQELSPRILHFGRHQIFWQCWGDAGSGPACEAFPKGMPMALSFARAHQKGLMASLSAEEREYSAVDLYSYWQSLVQAYSRCGITRKTDKLVALTGIAQKYALALKDDIYVAGLWHSQLIIGLCWQVDMTPFSGSPQSERYGSEVAPSWSWASVSGYIKLVDEWFLKEIRDEGMTILPLADVKGVALGPLNSQNPFGQLEYGRIALSGYIVHDVALEWLLSQSKTSDYGHRSKAVGCLTSAPSVTFMMCNFDDNKDLVGRERRRIRFTFYHKITGINLIPLVQWKHPSDPNTGFVEGIMVVSSDIEENAFRRVGHFRSVDHIFNNAGNQVDNLFFHMQENAGIVLV